jgi:hypothetical protein
LIALKLVQKKALVDLLQSYHALPFPFHRIFRVRVRCSPDYVYTVGVQSSADFEKNVFINFQIASYVKQQPNKIGLKREITTSILYGIYRV